MRGICNKSGHTCAPPNLYHGTRASALNNSPWPHTNGWKRSPVIPSPQARFRRGPLTARLTGLFKLRLAVSCMNTAVVATSTYTTLNYAHTMVYVYARALGLCMPSVTRGIRPYAPCHCHRQSWRSSRSSKSSEWRVFNSGWARVEVVHRLTLPLQ